MAGDWTAIEHTTPRKTEIAQIAISTGRSRHEVLGLMVEFWGWVETQTKTGTINMPLSALETFVGADAHFWRAVVSAGWIELPDGEASTSFNVPRANHWLSRGAKARLAKSRRQKKWRSKSRRRVDGDVSTKAPTTEQKRTEQNKCPTDTHTAAPSRVVPTTEIQAVVDQWNMLGRPFAMVSRIANKRRTAIRNRLADDWWRDNWRAGIDRVRGSPFCRGGGDSGWVATFDWFVRPDTLTKVLEGQYDERSSTGGRGARKSHGGSSAEVRQQGNADAITGFLLASGVREIHDGTDGVEANGGVHEGRITGVARRPGDVQADHD